MTTSIPLTSWFWARKVHRKLIDHSSNSKGNRHPSFVGVPHCSPGSQVKMPEETSRRLAWLLRHCVVWDSSSYRQSNRPVAQTTASLRESCRPAFRTLTKEEIWLDCVKQRQNILSIIPRELCRNRVWKILRVLETSVPGFISEIIQHLAIGTVEILKRSRLWSMEWHQFQWYWVTPNPNFVSTPLFNIEYLRNCTKQKHGYNEILVGTYALLNSVNLSDRKIFDDSQTRVQLCLQCLFLLRSF